MVSGSSVAAGDATTHDHRGQAASGTSPVELTDEQVRCGEDQHERPYGLRCHGGAGGHGASALELQRCLAHPQPVSRR